VVQLKNILNEVMSMSSQGDVSESDNDCSLEYQLEEETKQPVVKVIPYCCQQRIDG
jgi:hypothetical protein